MTIRAWQKDRVIEHVSGQFSALASSIGRKEKRKAALTIFNEDWKPKFMEMQQNFPEIYDRMASASMLLVGQLKFELPRETGVKYPVVLGLLGVGGWGEGEGQLIKEKDLEKVSTGDALAALQKARELEAQATTVKGLLKTFLEPFTDWGQVPFSLPQLSKFIEKELRRPVKSQKRPRVFVNPSEELRTLVTTALVLLEANKKGEE